MGGGGGARGSLVRLGPPLVLTALAVTFFVRSTLPALAERDDLRRARAAEEAEVEALRDAVHRDETWIEAVERGDPYVLERETDALTLSPAFPGPALKVQAPPADDAPDDGDDTGRDGPAEDAARR